jgi:hypothetical protein
VFHQRATATILTRTTFRYSAAEAIQSSPRKAVAPPGRRRVVDDDDDADQPRGRPRPRHEDDDDEADRPRRRRPRPEEASSGLLIGMLVGGGVLVAAVVGLILFFWLRSAADVAPPINFAGQQPPPGIQPPPAEIIQPARPRVRLDVKDTEIRDLITNGPANTRAVVHSWDLAGKTKHLFDVCDIPKAVRLTRLELVEPQQMDLSPDGSRLAVFTQSVDKGRLVRSVGVWSLPDGKPLVQNWTPYPNEADFAKQRELNWVYLLSAERILTISSQGQFDVWDLATQKNVASVPPIANNLSLSRNLSGRTAVSFAISPDRKTLAIHDKVGYSLFDTATGKSIGKTTPMLEAGMATNLWGVAFSPDGKTLASYYHRYHGNQTDVLLTHWSLPDGKQLSQAALPKDAHLNGGLAFWGPSHVLLWNGLITEAKVYNLANGGAPRLCSLRNQGKCVAQAHDGKLWFATAQALGGAAEFSSVEFPQQDLARFPPQPNDGRRWRLTPAGIEP